MRTLPIRYSTLSPIVNEDCLYIDKTHHIARLANNGRYYFLSRPRRFGKSLFLDSLKQAFLGNKALFNGLYLEKNWDWNKQYPIIHLSFGSGVMRTVNELTELIHAMLKRHFEQFEVQSSYEQSTSNRFAYLLQKIYEKTNTPIVVLVDEYDKPILDNIDDKALALQMREELKNLYSVIKDNDAVLKFVFFTGVSKFSKVSLFSGLNNLDNISLDPQYADICGYTHREMLTAFADYLEDGSVDLDELKIWYNGYNFAGLEEQKVYNPFDLLLFCNKGYQYRSYWFETATPSFLIKLMQQNSYFMPELEGLTVTDSSLASFDVDNIPLTTLLFQTGYLTIEKVQKIGTQYGYQLTYPNREVKASLNESLLTIGVSFDKKDKLFFRLHTILNNNALDELGELFSSHFASIPNDWYRKNTLGQFEGFYASVVYNYFAALGYRVQGEDVTNTGRIDLSITLPDKILILEFKLTQYGSASDAISQIKERGYSKKFEPLNLPIYLLGMSFNPETKNIDDYLWEKLSS
jgi:hypothetical protein